MHYQKWSKVLLAAGVLLIGSKFLPAQAQTPPATTYQPGYWQPLARVNPNSPITVVLVNQTQIPLKYNFLDEQGEKNLPVGASAQLKNVSLPDNIAIYDPSTQTTAGKSEGLKYQPSVTNNVVTVTILPVANSGFHVLEISRTGAIYRY